MTDPPFAWHPLLSFRVDGEPKGQPRARAFAINRCPAGHQFSAAKPTCPRCGHYGKPVARVHEDGSAEGWKALVAIAARPHRPPEPFDEPIRLDLDLYFQRPRAFSKRIRTAYGGRSRDIPAAPVLHLGKPDRDNAEKAVLDALVQCGFLRDDSIVCAGEVRKFYAAEGGRPGAEIRVCVWRRLENSP